MNINRPVFVREFDRGRRRFESPPHVQATMCKQSCAEAQSIGAVVVARDDNGRDPQLPRHLRQEFIKERDRVRRRDRPVVHIPSDQNRIDLGLRS